MVRSSMYCVVPCTIVCTPPTLIALKVTVVVVKLKSELDKAVALIVDTGDTIFAAASGVTVTQK